MSLVKAKLWKYDLKTKIESDACVVDFNPTTLKIQLANRRDTPSTQHGQVHQYMGESFTTLSVDLVFDTADAGTDVRKRTEMVARFMLPDPQAKQQPPGVMFDWGTIVIAGGMEAYSEDLELFSPAGVPLRAKVSISIKGQDRSLEKGKAGPEAGTDKAADDPFFLVPSGGSGPTRAPDRTELSIAGETAADFAARVGLDPAAWRSLRPADAATGLAAGLPTADLPGGVAIDFSQDISAGSGIGAQAGFAGDDPPVGGAGALVLGPGAPATVAGVAAAAAITASGGLGQAVANAADVSAAAASARARAAFAPAGGATPVPPAAARAGAVAPPMSALLGDVKAAADRRSATFGLGVPLRARGGPALAENDRRARGAVVVNGRRPAPASRFAPSWTRLPDDALPPLSPSCCDDVCAPGGSKPR